MYLRTSIDHPSLHTLLDKNSFHSPYPPRSLSHLLPPQHQVNEEVYLPQFNFLQKQQQLQEKLHKGREKCINQLIIESKGYVKIILLVNTMVDIIARILLMILVINLDDMYIEKWAFLILQLIIRTIMVCALCCITLNALEGNAVSSWLYHQRILQGFYMWGLVLPPELFFILGGRNKLTVYLVVNSIFRGIEVSILFIAMLWMVISYLQSSTSHSQDMLWLLGLTAQELTRFILLLAYMGCQHPHY